jgi:hypothetical protein
MGVSVPQETVLPLDVSVFNTLCGTPGRAELEDYLFRKTMLIMGKKLLNACMFSDNVNFLVHAIAQQVLHV